MHLDIDNGHGVSIIYDLLLAECRECIYPGILLSWSILRGIYTPLVDICDRVWEKGTFRAKIEFLISGIRG